MVKGMFGPDIVLFINGIPFAVIECKKASVSALTKALVKCSETKAYNMHHRAFFKFVQIVMSNKNETKYATVGTPAKFWSFWKEDNRIR